MMCVGRRVYDTVKQDYGTVVAEDGKGRYRVDWDDPPPSQPWIVIPYKWFQWADEIAQRDGDVCEP